MDCSTTHRPLHDIDLKQSWKAIGVFVVEMEDLEAIEDDDASVMAI